MVNYLKETQLSYLVKQDPAILACGMGHIRPQVPDLVAGIP